MKSALITGITGQDGSYLAELLLEKNYRVHGLVRRSSTSNLSRISHLLEGNRYKNQLILHEGDLSDFSSIKKAIKTAQPQEIYNLAAMSDVKSSFEMPEYAADVNGVAVLRLLETLRTQVPQAHFYQASTSELYGKVKAIPQNEETPFHPRSPYGIAKLYGYWAVINYREAYNLFACNGILFNHESPRRGENFVSRKVTLAVAKIELGLQDKLSLGNLNAKRDWGYAKDFVEGIWQILQQKQPKDYVLATGRTTTVREFVELAFQEIGIEIAWEGKEVHEKGRDVKSGKILVEVSPEFYRPAEVDLLIGDAAKAKAELGWTPRTSLKNLVKIMVEADLELCKSRMKGNLLERAFI